MQTPYRDGTTHVVFEPLDFIACIEEPALIERILEHVRGKTESDTASRGPPSTGPPLSA